MKISFKVGDRTYVNWCGAGVVIVGFKDRRILTKSIISGEVMNYAASELGPV
jgi:hypothetical protein